MNDCIGHFGQDGCSVSPFGRFLLFNPIDSSLSSVVCPSLNFFHSEAIFGVVYCKMDFPNILDLLAPSMVYNLPYHIIQWVWLGGVLNFDLV